jgi:hypothetical protein
VDHHIYAEPQEVLMPHRNAPLAETGRLRLARCVVEEGWPLRRAAERFQVSPTTAARWAARYRDSGAAGMADRPSRPHTSPRQTPVAAERRIVKLRVAKRLGPARIAFRLGLNPSTVHKVLARYHCPPLAHLDRASGRRVRRYERATPGELVHVDIKKLGTSPMAADGGSPGAPRASATGPPPLATAATATATPGWAMPTSTPPSTITPAWPTAKSMPMKPRKPRPRSGTGPTPGSAPPGSPSSG